jgi:hypothetical protein
VSGWEVLAPFFYRSWDKNHIMENFVKFIVDYIEKKEIHGKRGWIDQLSGYRWQTKSGIECFSDGLQRSKTLKLKTQQILKSSNNDENWCRHCNEIATWGGMKEISADLADIYQKSVSFLLTHDPGIKSDFKNLPISGERIAMASCLEDTILSILTSIWTGQA